MFFRTWPIRAAVLGAAACAIALASTPAEADGTQEAYQATLKCFVVNAVASGDFQDLGKTDKATAFDAKAHASFDLAVKFGRELGYSNKRINGDLASVRARELSPLMHDRNYYQSAVGTCKAMGLM